MCEGNIFEEGGDPEAADRGGVGCEWEKGSKGGKKRVMSRRGKEVGGNSWMLLMHAVSCVWIRKR